MHGSRASSPRMLLSPPAAAAREAHCSDAVNAVIIGMFSSYRISTLSQTLKLLDYEKEKKKREIESGEQSEDHCIHCITASLHQRSKPVDGFRGHRGGGGSGAARHAGAGLAGVGARQPPAFTVDAHHHFRSSPMPASKLFFSSAAFRSSAALSASAAASRSAGATSFRP